jgi:hypothetical protein
MSRLGTERLVPADPEVQRIVARILQLRARAPAVTLPNSEEWLLPRQGSPHTVILKQALAAASR